LFQAVSSQGQCRTLFCLFHPECAVALGKRAGRIIADFNLSLLSRSTS
jgi:hypothetical protein